MQIPRYKDLKTLCRNLLSDYMHSKHTASFALIVERGVGTDSLKSNDCMSSELTGEEKDTRTEIASGEGGVALHEAIDDVRDRRQKSVRARCGNHTEEWVRKDLLLEDKIRQLEFNRKIVESLRDKGYSEEVLERKRRIEFIIRTDGRENMKEKFRSSLAGIFRAHYLPLLSEIGLREVSTVPSLLSLSYSLSSIPSPPLSPTPSLSLPLYPSLSTPPSLSLPLLLPLSYSLSIHLSSFSSSLPSFFGLSPFLLSTSSFYSYHSSSTHHFSLLYLNLESSGKIFFPKKI